MVDMLPTSLLHPLKDGIDANCAISDARDNGIYSMCTLFLRLRNLYKWEHGKLPWQEAEPAELLDWIEKKEAQWLEVVDKPFEPLPIGNGLTAPDHIEEVNRFLELHDSGLLYGAGYGRSLKAIFFLAELKQSRRFASHPVHICDKELCRELSSPFAMHQDGSIYFRLDPFRYFLWDKIQEAEGARAKALRFALSAYGLIGEDGKVIRPCLQDRFEEVIQQEMEPILFHELGELAASPLSGPVLPSLIEAFPDSPVELVARGVKDILADTCEGGMLQHIIQQEKSSSLGFYAAMLDGMRRELFRDFAPAFEQFQQQKDWWIIEQVRQQGYQNNLARAAILCSVAGRLADSPAASLMTELEQKVLFPLDLPSFHQQGKQHG